MVRADVATIDQIDATVTALADTLEPRSATRTSARPGDADARHSREGPGLSRDKQVDHTVPFDRGGTAGVGNYGPMTVLHHRIKTHGRWQVREPFPGIYVWRDEHGAFYVVDHTGTRRTLN